MNIELANSSALATARWADPDYIFDRYPFEPGTIWLGRNPHGFDQAVGYGDDRHVLVCAGSGAGKGRSFIVNNGSVWPGSIVAYDPKGDIPDILAARRGPGDQYCEGMGQEVFVLDPLGHTNLGPEYLAYFDPLDALDPDDGELHTKATRIARSIVAQAKGGNSQDWRDRAIQLIAIIICHVVTGNFGDDKRNLMHVLKLLLEGYAPYVEAIETIREQKLQEAIDNGDQDAYNRTKATEIPDPTIVMLEEMVKNTGMRGWISSEARSLLRNAKNTPKYFESVRGEATEQLNWFKSEGIEIALTGKSGDDERLPSNRRLDPHRLKSDPKGIAVFIVMPVDDLETYLPWVQCVFQGIFAAHRKDKTAPESGHQTLCIIDEFLSLGHQDYVANALDNIRSAGMKLMIVVQNFGSLFAEYKEQIESFQSNVGLEVYFGKIGDKAGDYLTKNLGDTLIVTQARSVNKSQAEAHQKSRTKTIGKSTSVTDSESLGESSTATATEGHTSNVTDTQGISDNVTHGTTDSENWNKGQSKTRGVNWSDTEGWNRGENVSDSRNWGESQGDSMGRNYGPGLFDVFAKSKSRGVNSSQNRGGSRSHGSSWGKNGSSTRGGQESHTKNWSTGGSRGTSRSQSRGTTQSQSTSEGSSRSFARAEGETRTLGKSWQSGDNESTAEQSGDTETYTIGFGVAEGFHKRPLLTFDEMNRCFRSFSREDRDHPAYPGLILCRIDGELPFFLRRCNYDEDPYFEGCFSASPEHGFTPLAEIPTHGYQYTEDHLVHIQLPPKLIEYDFRSEALVRRFEWLEPGQPLFKVYPSDEKAAIIGKVPIRARVVDMRRTNDENAPLLSLKMDRPITDDELLGYTQQLFGPSLLKIETEEARLRRIREEEERKRREAAAAAAEAERLKREAERLKREAEEAARIKREEEEAERQRQLEIERLLLEKQRKREAEEQQRKERLAREAEQRKENIRKALIFCGCAAGIITAISLWANIPRPPKTLGTFKAEVMSLEGYNHIGDYHLRLTNPGGFRLRKDRYVKIWGLDITDNSHQLLPVGTEVECRFFERRVWRDDTSTEAKAFEALCENDDVDVYGRIAGHPSVKRLRHVDDGYYDDTYITAWKVNQPASQYTFNTDVLPLIRQSNKPGINPLLLPQKPGSTTLPGGFKSELLDVAKINRAYKLMADCQAGNVSGPECDPYVLRGID